jgi:GPI mannosyltransferase 4
MGSYHQAGIVPAQLALPKLIPPTLNATNSMAHNIEVFWWKTYPPPTYLLGSPPPLHPTTKKPLNISTVPLMGLSQSDLVFMLMQHVPTCDPSLLDFLTPHSSKTEVLVAAPLSAWRLPQYPEPHDFSFSVSFSQPKAILGMRNLATFRRHVNLDDMDVGDDGVVETLKRVVGRRGLGVWRVERVCEVKDEKGEEIRIVAESVVMRSVERGKNGKDELK